MAITWSQNTNTLVGSVLIVNRSDAMTIFNSCDLVAKPSHISWLCTDSNITGVTTIFKSYDMVAKNIHISWLFADSKLDCCHDNIQ